MDHTPIAYALGIVTGLTAGGVGFLAISVRHALQADDSKPPMDFSAAMFDVLAERHRQVFGEGFTPTQDDAYKHGDLCLAGACYAVAASRGNGVKPYWEDQPPLHWPWTRKWWKPEGVRSSLVKAAALIIAEIEKLDRRAAKAKAETSTIEVAP